MSLKISRILHAGYMFECEQTQIAFDPIFENPFSRNCYAYPNVQFDHEQIKKLKLDAVFISHFHDDHCSLESLYFLDRKTPIYIYCVFEELFSWIKQLGFTSVYSLEIDQPIQVGSFEVIPKMALDSEVDSIFHIKANGLNVLNVVDSWIGSLTLESLLQNDSWDMVLWPFQTMREIEVLAPSRAVVATAELPTEWIDQLKKLNPRYIVPSSCQFLQESWSWYNHAFFPVSYSEFQKQIQAALPNCEVLRMNPSVSIVLDKQSAKASTSLSWIKPIGDQDVDYQYRSDIKPPTTAEISQKFAPLGEKETERVFDYCNRGLLEKYKSMEPPLDVYFEKPRFWRLSIYDHKGLVTHFYYRLIGKNIERVLENKESLSWTTEVPISKLYSALELGEALTSMYMRINDFVFELEIEKEIDQVDIVDDPLIRCLFNGVFGAYQSVQLKRILDQNYLR